MMNAIDQRFDQPGFDSYPKMESLLFKNSEKLKFTEKLYTNDVNILKLTDQMGILQVLLKDGDHCKN